MGEYGALKLLRRRVYGDAIGSNEGISGLDLFLQNDSRFAGGQFSGADCFRTATAREDSLSRSPQIAHPIHYSKGGTYIALPVPCDNRYRDSTRKTAFAPAYREQIHGVAPNYETWSYERKACAQQGYSHNICHANIHRGFICFCHYFLCLFSMTLTNLK